MLHTSTSGIWLNIKRTNFQVFLSVSLSHFLCRFTIMASFLASIFSSPASSVFSSFSSLSFPFSLSGNPSVMWSQEDETFTICNRHQNQDSDFAGCKVNQTPPSPPTSCTQPAATREIDPWLDLAFFSQDPFEHLAIEPITDSRVPAEQTEAPRSPNEEAAAPTPARGLLELLQDEDEWWFSPEEANTEEGEGVISEDESSVASFVPVWSRAKIVPGGNEAQRASKRRRS